MNHIKEAENRRKSLTITVVFHSILFMLGVIPFIVEVEVEPDFSRAIEIDFSDNASRSSGSAASTASQELVRSARAEKANLRKAVAQIVPVKAVKQVPKLAPMDLQKDIVTTPEPDIYVPPPRETYFDEPLDVPLREEADLVEALPVEVAVAEPPTFESWSVEESEESIAELEALPGQPAGDEGAQKGRDAWLEGDLELGSLDMFDAGAEPGWSDSDWPGEGETGTTTGNGGKETGEGSSGSGRYWGDLAGDGLFNRKVVKRANVGRLAELNGRIVVNLCVDKEGNVTVAECDRNKSTIQLDRLVTMAEDCARRYLFERDFSAPSEQCGRLTFIFKIER